MKARSNSQAGSGRCRARQSLPLTAGRKYQRGMLLIVAVVLIAVAATMATAIVTLTTGGNQGGGMQLNSTQALYAAESGIERALYGFTNGTACSSLSYTNISVGQGSFTATGTLYNPASTTLSSNINATVTYIPVASVAGYATHGRITIGSEAINYTGKSTDTTVCSGYSACFTGAIRGAGGTTATTHNSGDTVTQSQCVIGSTGSVNGARRTVESAVTGGTSKNVQSGSVTMNPATRAVTLGAAVNPALSFVVCYNRTDSSNPTNRVTCEITNATTVTVTASATNSSNVVQWYVVEFSSGMTVQRGVASFGNGTGTVNVSLSPAVDLGKAFVLTSERINTTDQGRDERWNVRARLSSTTNLELTRNETGTALSVAWQVIEMNDAAVQSGLVSIANGSASNTAAITAVDPTRSFLVFSRRTQNNVNGVEGLYQVRGELTNNTTLTFTRAGTQRQIDIAWFVISLNDGTTVQRGTATAAAGTNTQNILLSPSVTLSRSFPLVSASGANNGQSADLDSTSWTPAFPATNNLRLERAGTGTLISSSVAWFAINLGFDPTRIDWLEVYP